MALNNKISLLLRYTCNRMSTFLTPVRWTLAPELTAQKEVAVRGYLEHFAEFATREDVIGASCYLNQLHELGCRVRISPSILGTLNLDVSNEQDDIKALSQELLAINMRLLPDASKWVLVSTLVSSAQTLYRR